MTLEPGVRESRRVHGSAGARDATLQARSRRNGAPIAGPRRQQEEAAGNFPLGWDLRAGEGTDWGTRFGHPRPGPCSGEILCGCDAYCSGGLLCPQIHPAGLLIILLSFGAWVIALGGVGGAQQNCASGASALRSGPKSPLHRRRAGTNFPEDLS